MGKSISIRIGCESGDDVRQKNRMNRFLLNLLPAAAAILVAAAALSSCEKGPGPEEQQAQQEQEKSEKTEQFWDVVGQLVAGSDITPDYKGKTFEPVIGVADASDPQARIVPTNSAAAAARSFANLVGVDSIDENTPSYTWTNPEVGTLTYTKMSGTAWAEVKVTFPNSSTAVLSKGTPTPPLPAAPTIVLAM